MGFGFSPKFELEVRLVDLTKEQFLLLGVASAKKLGWNLGPISSTGFLAYTQFSMSSWSEVISITIQEEKVLLKSECSGSQLFDWGKNRKNIEGFMTTLRELKERERAEDINQKYLELSSSFASVGNDSSQTPFVEKGRFKNFFSLFIPSGGYFITPIIINLNIAIFIAMILSGVSVMLPDGQSLINWGANFRPVTLEGQPWRLLTSCFVHIGIIHLLMNMYALAYVGMLLEPQLGKTRFAAAYVFTGLIASTASLWWHDLTINAGASGAIFGLYGVFLAMLTTDLIEKPARRSLLTSVLVFVGYNLLNGFKEGIDNAAHLGGLVSGLIIGFVFIPSLRDADEDDRKTKAVSYILVAVIGFIFMAYKTIPNDLGQYDRGMKDFANYESTALYCYSLPERTSNEEKLSSINDDGIPNWNKCLKLIGELDKLNLPDIIHQRDAKLIEYCKLRIKSYEFAAKSIQENTNQYQPQMDSLTKRIEEVITSLKENK